MELADRSKFQGGASISLTDALAGAKMEAASGRED